MTEGDIEIVLQRAKEKYPDASPRVISDNGPQFIAKDFKEFIRISGMTHVRTSPYYPQSNGKIERWHGTLKQECIRPGVLLDLEDARQVVGRFVEHYNEVRLNSAIGYIAPADKLKGKDKQIFKERDRKLESARQARKIRRAEANAGKILASTPPIQAAAPIGSEGAEKLPSAHRTVRTDPYTAPHATRIHRRIPNQCFSIAFDLSLCPNTLVNQLLG
jgi:hypothetical protein